MKKRCKNCWYAILYANIYMTIESNKVLCHIFRYSFWVSIDGHCRKWKSKSAKH